MTVTLDLSQMMLTELQGCEGSKGGFRFAQEREFTISMIDVESPAMSWVGDGCWQNATQVTESNTFAKKNISRENPILDFWKFFLKISDNK